MRSSQKAPHGGVSSSLGTTRPTVKRDQFRVESDHDLTTPCTSEPSGTSVTYRPVDGPTVATLVVAAATLLLALATFRLGKRAAEETRAQWRPVLLVRARRDPADQKLHVGEDFLAVEIENVGRGPALDVTAARHDASRAFRRISALAPQETAEVSVPTSADEAVVVLRLSYSDLSKAGYGTSIVLGVDDRPELLMQYFETRPPLTFWWSVVVPTRFRRHLWPLVRWNLKRHGYTVPKQEPHDDD